MSIAFGCAAEPDAAWAGRVEMLAWSLRTFGGALADAPLHACFAGPIDDVVAAPLRALGVHVHVVERFDPRLSYANKLRLLELDLAPGIDALAMVDCDIVFAGDPSPYLPVDRVAAKPADRDPLDRAGWVRLCGALGLPVPPRDVVATCTGRAMPRYWNSGVVVIPRDQLVSMRDAWRGWLHRVVGLLDDDPLIVPRARRLFADQYALMAAMAEHESVALPLAANCPTHVPIHRSVPLGGEPALLHYHARTWPDGLLQRPVAGVVRPAAHRYNVGRAEALELRFTELRDPPPHERARDAVGAGADLVRASRMFTRVRAAAARGRESRPVA
ncbi:MAG: hypothetical protein JHC95_17635 [Solirubrobacteraceae bacterium]|nr:hypothetical protein [Solirubrobacteraceae bacterium]